jgi:hypothetical protein
VTARGASFQTMTWADAIRLVEHELQEQRWGPMPQAALRSVMAEMKVRQVADTQGLEQQSPKTATRLQDWGEQ